jgi:hypothetical protein
MEPSPTIPPSIQTFSKILPTPIDIVPIEGRTTEGDGVSRPFRCLGEDGGEYFVKLKSIGWNHLVKEWIAGRLAQEMGLAAAEVAQVRIPRELVAGNAEMERDLGHGVAFGSRRVEPAERLALAFVPDDPDGRLSRILLFDWWIRNADRALTATGGNPNLLWEIEPGRVVIFDHDNAFDDDFDTGQFWQYHALRAHRSAWESARRQEMTSWLEAGATCLDRIWDELPEEWLHDFHGDRRCTLDKVDLKSVLSSFDTNPDYWSLPAAP